MREMRCERCRDGGVVVNRTDGTWDVCACDAGRRFDAEIVKGRADIEAGRFVRWEDIKRTADRLSRMAAGYFG